MLAYQLTLVFALLLVVIELLTGSFIFLGFSIGMAFVSLMQLITGALNWNRDAIIFVLGTSFSVFCFRKYFKSKSDTKNTSEKDINIY